MIERFKNFLLGAAKRASRVRHGGAYPVFRSAEESTDLSEILPCVSAEYFASSVRFQCKKTIESVELVADTQYWDEGDWWAITLLSINYADNSSEFVFLPILHTILSNADPRLSLKIDGILTAHPELIAYGHITKSAYFGRRDWVAYDAFLEESFADIIIGLFWPNSPFWSLEAVSNGDNVIAFNSSVPEIEELSESDASTKIKSNGDVEVSCGDLQLFVPRIANNSPIGVDIGREVIGQIEYKMAEDILILGILSRGI